MGSLFQKSERKNGKKFRQKPVVAKRTISTKMPLHFIFFSCYEITIQSWDVEFHRDDLVNQEAHGPHRSPEKTVQINKHERLYHNID